MPRTQSAALLCALWIPIVAAQGLPKPSPDAKACAWLPVAELEAHFKTKAQNVGGLDQSTRNTCTARFADPSHVAVLESHPSSPADVAMTAAERLALLKDAMKVLDAKDYGSTGCFRTSMNLGKPVQMTTCFLGKAAYLSLALQGPEPASYEAVKGMLEKAASLRK